MLEKRQGVKTSKHSSDKILHMGKKKKTFKVTKQGKSILHHIWFSFFRLIDALSWWETKKKRDVIWNLFLFHCLSRTGIFGWRWHRHPKKTLVISDGCGWLWAAVVMVMWRIKIMMSHQSKLQVVSSRKEQGGGLHMQSMYYYCPPPPPLVLDVARLEKSGLSPFFFPCLAPSLPGAAICLWGDGASKHWVLWSFPPPVVSVRCKQTRPGTSLPRRIPGDPADPTCRGDRPLQVFPEVLSLRAYRPEPLHRYRGGLQSDRV